MSRAKPLWLGSADRYVRLRRIESLEPEIDFREITALFYTDFASVMLPQAFSGFMLTFAAPRMSRILSATGELEHRVAKRVVDTALFARTIVEHGFSPGPGRDAARRVNAMHKRYDIHEDDFVVVGCDAALVSIALAEKYGWRPVTDKEREAVRIFNTQQTRAFGGPKPLPPTTPELAQFWSDYLDRELRFEPQNRRLADAVLAWFSSLAPRPLRPLVRSLLLANVDPRVLRACGLPAPPKPATWLAEAVMKLIGRRDPIADGAPDGMAALVQRVYPNGWSINELGTHVLAKSAP